VPASREGQTVLKFRIKYPSVKIPDISNGKHSQNLEETIFNVLLPSRLYDFMPIGLFHLKISLVSSILQSYMTNLMLLKVIQEEN
jgi:hypothetical protein